MKINPETIQLHLDELRALAYGLSLNGEEDIFAKRALSYLEGTYATTLQAHQVRLHYLTGAQPTDADIAEGLSQHPDEPFALINDVFLQGVLRRAAESLAQIEPTINLNDRSRPLVETASRLALEFAQNEPEITAPD